MRAVDKSVLHGVVMNVIEVAVQIFLIADQVFPEPPLPHVGFAVLDAGGGSGRQITVVRRPL